MQNRNEIGALILRVVLGLIFATHGLIKFQGEGGIAGIAGWFDSIGLPGFLAYIVAVIELVGGIALILGVGTRIVSALLAIILVGAIVTVQLSVGFIGGYAYDLALLAMAVYLFLNSSSMYSLGHLLFKGKQDR